MSRRKTQPEDIRNPEHYFNKYIAKEVLHDSGQAAHYHVKHHSLEAILLGEDPLVSRKKLLPLTFSEERYLLRNREYRSVKDWLAEIVNQALFQALSSLNNRQQLILLYCYDYLLSQREVAELLHISQQAVYRGSF